MSEILILNEEEKNDSKKKSDDNVQDTSQTSENTSFMDKVNNYLVSMQNIKVKEKVVFFRLLSTMTNAGMSILKSIIVLEKQEKNPVFKKIL